MFSENASAWRAGWKIGASKSRPGPVVRTCASQAISHTLSWPSARSAMPWPGRSKTSGQLMIVNTSR
jgi:hypothetical protein